MSPYNLINGLYNKYYIFIQSYVNTIHTHIYILSLATPYNCLWISIYTKQKVLTP